MERYPAGATPQEVVSSLERGAATHENLSDYLREIYEVREHLDLLATVGFATGLVRDAPHQIDVQGSGGAFNEGCLVGLRIANSMFSEDVLTAMDETAPAEVVKGVMDWMADEQADPGEPVDTRDARSNLVGICAKGFDRAPQEYKDLVRKWAPTLAHEAIDVRYVELGFGFVWSMISGAVLAMDDIGIERTVLDEASVEHLHDQISQFLIEHTDSD